ncbi:MAG: type II toxin-antitoxin system death-on-curing family toxin [Thermoguttaceae bacterium]|nr:type II toxin-antitoxin system death-on-curing family toxin [Thermoguttaceae bacterium]
MEIDFLSIEDVLSIHVDQLTRYGGISGIRDIGLLESAVAMPAITFDNNYVHTSLPEMAAAYLFHIARNHPFLDGNKRTATVAALVFLRLNGFYLETSDEELTQTVLDVVSGTVHKNELASFIDSHLIEVQNDT